MLGDKTFALMRVPQNKYAIWSLVVIVIVGIFAYQRGWLSHGPRYQRTGSYSQELPVLSRQSLSKLPQGFPRYLVLGADPIVQLGQKVIIDGNRADKVAFTTSDSPQSLREQYQKLLSNTGWTPIPTGRQLKSGEIEITFKRGIERVTFYARPTAGNKTLAIVFYIANYVPPPVK